MLESYLPFLISRSRCFVVSLALLACAPCQVWADNAALVEQGRLIYEKGIIGSGKQLEGWRADNNKIAGNEAACVSCHRPSGMGSVEGDILVAPITGNYLFNPDKVQLANMDPRSGKKFNQTHPAYTEASLATTLVSGMDNQGRTLFPLMPRYYLATNDMAALSAYLKQLSIAWSPGVDTETLHLATVITPEVEPERRKAFLDTLHTAVKHKNGNTSTAANKKGRRHMTSAAEMVLGTERKWDLQVWELQGTPDTWNAQLTEKYKSHPVFAVVSGVSNADWEPVHDFCESNHVPGWFPSVILPVTTESFYSLYFSKGVILEAEVLANQLKQVVKPKRLVQIFSNDPVAKVAAKNLRDALAKTGIALEERVVKEGVAISAQLPGDLTNKDVVMFWLRDNDLINFDNSLPPKVKALYFSSELAGRTLLPEAWRQNAQLLYPYQLPDQRQSNLTNFHAWLAMNKLPIVDESLQAEAFFAVEFLTETVSEMLDNLYRDYLVERAEAMLSRSESIKSEQQVRERQIRGKTGPLIQQHSTSIYPHLGLGIGQRFASKGAYLVHYDKDAKLQAKSDWIVP